MNIEVRLARIGIFRCCFVRQSFCFQNKRYFSQSQSQSLLIPLMFFEISNVLKCQDFSSQPWPQKSHGSTCQLPDMTEYVSGATPHAGLRCSSQAPRVFLEKLLASPNFASARESERMPMQMQTAFRFLPCYLLTLAGLSLRYDLPPQKRFC